MNAVETSLNQPERITAAELEKVLEQAREESWTAVSLVSPRAAGWDDVVRELPPGPVYVIEALPKELVRVISGLTKVSSVGLLDLKIGDEGARALASLPARTARPDRRGNAEPDERITAAELEKVLEQAREESWLTRFAPGRRLG